MLLHKDEKVFKEIIVATAASFGLKDYQVEKDYYVSLFLKELSKLTTDISIVFKGGTSLSKCYSIIDRFSEDIDLAVKFNNNKVTSGERRILKKMILQIIESLNLNFLNPDEVRSRRDYNEYHVGYDNSYVGDSEMGPHIIVETIVVYRPYPCETKKVSNYITKYLETNDESELIRKYELQPFEMMIQTVERTFIDKLFAICDYHLDQKYFRYSRHIYDLHMIWNSGILNHKLIESIIEEVIKDRQLNGVRNYSCNPGAEPRKVIKEIIDRKVYEDDYNEVTLGFIHKPVEYETCIRTLELINKENIIPEIIKEY